MRVFIAGATGVLGRRLVSQFTTRGHEVVGLARGPEGEREVAALGGRPASADLFDVGSLSRAAQGADVVVRAATSIPRTVRLRMEDWAMNDRIRREGTRALTECTACVGAKMYLQEGIVWIAQPTDGAPFDETSPVAPRLWYQSAADAETIARDAAARHGFRVATLRCGMFYCADGAQTRMMGEALARRRMPVIVRGDAVWANLHADDAASAFVAVAEAGRGGTWHLVDDRPSTMAEFLTAFARILKAPEPRRVPRWLASLLVGRNTTAFLTASTRTTNARIRSDLGWRPRYPGYAEGLRQVAEAWGSEGFLSRRPLRTPSGPAGRPV